MDKQAFMEQVAARGYKMATENREAVVEGLEEMLKRAKEGQMDYILYNIGNVLGKAAKAQQTYAEAAAMEQAITVMNHVEATQ